MPNFQYLFVESLWIVRDFFSTPRKIHAVFPAVTIFAFWRIIFEYRKVTGYTPVPNPLTIAVFSALTMAFAYGACYAGSLLIKRTKPRFWIAKYLVTIGIAVSPIAVFFAVGLGRPIIDAIEALFRLIVLVGVTESIAGFLISNVQKRTKELESHQKSLIQAEESFRRLVSAHLHDNLQTRLVAIGIQLNQIKASVDDANAARILATIDEIESIRSLQVRDFGREITPNFQIDSLGSTLLRLFLRYKDVISCDLHNFEIIDIENQPQRDYALGIYRITEQALSNSLAHGKASKFDVYAESLVDEIKLTITNNGHPYEGHASKQGHGFAVIDAWVSKFNGSWAISNHENKVLIEVSLKI